MIASRAPNCIAEPCSTPSSTSRYGTERPGSETVAAELNRRGLRTRTSHRRSGQTVSATAPASARSTKHDAASFTCRRPRLLPAAGRCRAKLPRRPPASGRRTARWGRGLHRPAHEHAQRLAALRRAITDTDNRSMRLARNFIRDLNRRRGELRQHGPGSRPSSPRPNTTPPRRPTPAPGRAAGRRARPRLPAALTRALFEALRLQVRNKITNTATYRITLSAETLHAADAASNTISNPLPRSDEKDNTDMTEERDPQPLPLGSLWCPRRERVTLSYGGRAVPESGCAAHLSLIGFRSAHHRLPDRPGGNILARPCGRVFPCQLRECRRTACDRSRRELWMLRS
jgi:hypothetical protein